MDMRVDFFDEEGYVRKQCESCGEYYWTKNPNRKTCGDPPCDDYEFIGEPQFDKEYSMNEMREKFLSFFEENKHDRVDRYPVVPRWRDDVLLVGASIMDFQPWVISGQAEPPANPLTVSQPSIRFTDIDNVGLSGRHFTIFEMMAHHAFNITRDVYWMDQTVRYCDEFARSLNIDTDLVTYKESPWSGGGNAGPAFEVLYKGVEIATLVFMQYETANGDEEEILNIKGKDYTLMGKKIVDTGYGLERYVWASQGTKTAYEAVFPEIVPRIKNKAGVPSIDEEIMMENARLSGLMDVEDAGDLRMLRERVADQVGIDPKELERKMKPYERVYAIADHTKSLAFMLGDGVVPSNVGTGYLSRMLLRRVSRYLDDLDMEIPISEIVAWQIEDLDKFQTLEERKDEILEMVDHEEQKYEETLDKGGRLVNRKIGELQKQNQKEVPLKVLKTLYKSHGVMPETVKDKAEKKGLNVEIPDNFFSLLAQDQGTEEETIKDEKRYLDSSYPETEELFYEESHLNEFTAEVLGIEDNWIILDKTAFYPEGGGQPSDRGTINTIDVLSVQRENGVIIHKVNDPEAFSVGENVHGKIDWDRRSRIMKHHTATHVILGAAVRVLGDHVWQAGSDLSEDSARIDISHHERLSREDVKEIEKLANQAVMDRRDVHFEYVERTKAEQEYGFRIYQGGPVPGRELRILKVDKWDVEACGGTHVDDTGEIGFIKILNTEKIQDGIERIIFASGHAALEQVQHKEDLLSETAETFRVSEEDAPKTAKKFFNEWKDRGKEIDKLKQEIASLREVNIREVSGLKIKWDILENVEPNDLRDMGFEMKEDDSLVLLVSEKGFIVIAGDKVLEKGLSAMMVKEKLTSVTGGSGGGRDDMVQGGGINPGKIEKGIKEAVNYCEEMIQQ